MSRTRLQVRLYAAGGPAAGRAFPPKAVLAASWRITRLSGYADANLELAGLPSEHPGLLNDARIEFWGWDDTQQTYLRLYRGYVLQAIGQGRRPDQPRKTLVTLFGFWDRLARQVALQRFLEPSAVDLSVIFDFLLSRWASPAIVGATYTTDYQTTTTTLSTLDAYRVPVSEALSRLDGVAARQIVAGCDVDGAGNDRVYIRPIQTAPGLVAALPDPSNHIELIESGEDARQRANVLHVIGGKAQWGNLFAALTRSQDGATGQGNSSFENPRLGGNGYGDLVLNGGFDSGLTSWTTVSGDPAVKDTADPEGPAYSGSKLLELDNNAGAEEIKQTITTGIFPGASYAVDFAAKAETAAGTPPEGLIELHWLDSGSPLSISSISFGGALSPVAATWQKFRVPAVAPANANQVEIHLSAPVATENFGLHLDSLQFFRSDSVFQEGWETAAKPGGLFGEVDWAVTNPVNAASASMLPYHGAYCVLVHVTAAAVGNECYLRPRAETNVAVQGGNAYRFSKRSLSPDGETVTPARNLVIVELEADGTTIIDTHKKSLPSGAAFTVWTEEVFARTLSQECRFVRCWEEYLEPGKLYSDAFQLRDSAAPAGEFVEGESFEAIYRVDDAPLGLTSPISDSIADLGLWPEVIQEDAAVDQSDGQALARATLEERAISQMRPRVVWVGSPTLPGSAAPPWPGQVIKTMGSVATSILPNPYPIVEILGTWSEVNGAMLMRMTASLETDPLTDARIIQRMIRRVRSFEK